MKGTTGLVSWLMVTASVASSGASLAEEAKNPATRSFAGLSLGVALSFTQDTDDNRVQEAVIEPEVENGQVIYRVRVTEQSNSRTRIMLESHYFFVPKRHLPLERDKFALGMGPFVAIQPGSEEIIEAFGAGFMVGFKRAGFDSAGFNIGIGAVLDSNVQVLGDGFVENESAPIGQDGQPLPIRYKETDQFGFLFLVSFAF